MFLDDESQEEPISSLMARMVIVTDLGQGGAEEAGEEERTDQEAGHPSS